MAVLEGGSPRRVEELLSTEDELDSKQKQEIKQLRGENSRKVCFLIET